MPLMVIEIVPQAQRSPDSDGGPRVRVRGRGAAQLLHPRRRVHERGGAGRLPAPPGPGREPLQLVLQVEGKIKTADLFPRLFERNMVCYVSLD